MSSTRTTFSCRGKALLGEEHQQEEVHMILGGTFSTDHFTFLPAREGAKMVLAEGITSAGYCSMYE